MRRAEGFTLVELLVVAVVGAMVVAATYQVLLVNQRTYTAQNAQIEGQQTVRAGLDVLFSELRELSTDGDILGFGSDSLRVRVMRRFGLVCAVNLAGSTIDVVKVGQWFEENEAVAVFAENALNNVNDDAWLSGSITARDTTQSCSGRPAQRLTVAVVATAALASPPDSVRVGAPVRSREVYTYGLYTIDGEAYLARREPGLAPQPLVGPLRPNDGLQFAYYDTLGAVATTAADIAQVQVTLRTLSQVTGPDGRLMADSISTRIYARN